MNKHINSHVTAQWLCPEQLGMDHYFLIWEGGGGGGRVTILIKE